MNKKPLEIGAISKKDNNIMNQENKERILKNFALSQWLVHYDFDKPVELFDALMDCGENEDQFDEVVDGYEVEILHTVEDWYFEYLIQKIRDTYSAAIKLDKALKGESCD